jgi:hypothetical protein
MMHTNEQYKRVIPRDLFNESKLLKCVGRLVILIHDGFAVNGMQFDHDAEPFKIALSDDGFLMVTNIRFTIGDHELTFKSLYNSKYNWPLYLEHDNCDFEVFDENGEYSDEFKDICNTIAAITQP